MIREVRIACKKAEETHLSGDDERGDDEGEEGDDEDDQYPVEEPLREEELDQRRELHFALHHGKREVRPLLKMMTKGKDGRYLEAAVSGHEGHGVDEEQGRQEAHRPHEDDGDQRGHPSCLLHDHRDRHDGCSQKRRRRLTSSATRELFPFFFSPRQKRTKAKTKKNESEDEGGRREEEEHAPGPVMELMRRHQLPKVPICFSSSSPSPPFDGHHLLQKRKRSYFPAPDVSASRGWPSSIFFNDAVFPSSSPRP